MSKYDLVQDLNCLHQPHAKMTEDYMARRGAEMLRRLPYPESREEWETMRVAIRRRLVQSLGGMEDERTPLQPETVGRVERPDHTIERIRLQTRPGWFVGLNLYLPREFQAPLPTVLCVHGHWPDGKRARHVQARAVTFTRRGYAACALDMPGFGERDFQTHRDVAVCLAAVGRSLPGLQLWDNMRVLDYLCQRPEVNPQALGCTGASGGGNQTTYLSAFDERIAACAPVCSCETYDVLFRKACCLCETIPDILSYADEPHLLGLIAPRALLMVNGIIDGGFPALKAREALDRLKLIYRFYDPEKLGLAETYFTHAYERNFREDVYRWFDRWLKGVDPGPVGEEPVWVEAHDSDVLLVGGLQQEGSKTIADLYAGWSRPLHRQRETLSATPEQLRQRLAGDILRLPEPYPLAAQRPDTDAQVVAFLQRPDCAIETLVFHSEDDILIPALLLKPAGQDQPDKVAIWLSPEGKQYAAERREAKALLDAGCAVLALDLRGLGETAGDSMAEYSLHFRGLITGRQMLGQLVYDIVRAVDYLAERADTNGARVYLWAEKTLSAPALFAAALDSRLAGLAACGCPATYMSQEGFNWPGWMFPRHILQVADLPDVAALVGPRPLALVNPVGGMGQALDEAALAETFAITAAAFAAAGAPGAFTVLNAGTDAGLTAMLSIV